MSYYKYKPSDFGGIRTLETDFCTAYDVFYSEEIN